MFVRSHLVLLVCIVGLCFSQDRISVGMEHKQNIPEGWRRTGDAPKDAPLRLIIALKQQNTQLLEKIFWEVSTPGSSSYGKFLSQEEITQLVAPHPDTILKVNQWLDSHGVKQRSTVANKDFIHIFVNVETAEVLLDTKFHTFFHAARGIEVVRSLGPYSVPLSVGDSIDFITGHLSFPAFRQTLTGPLGATLPVGPAELRQRYNISSSTVGTNPRNSQAVAEFQDQFFSQSDLTQFFNSYVTFQSNLPSTVAKIVGENEPSNPGVEASLDIQYIMGVAPNVSTWFWSNPAFDFWSDLTDWLNQIANTTNPPLVHSVSYGPAGSYKDRLNVEFQKLGTQGLSIIFASGDSGTGCDLCYYYEPSFPATSPYVTSVGATRFLNDQVGPEGAVEAFGSGGGMSWHFKQPSYQKEAVEKYFATEADLPESHYYDRTGRGTPDVAALGIGFQVVVAGSVNSVGGTSASAPTFAGIVSLLNDLRLNKNQPPLAASHPSAFFDVTEGNNQHGCCLYTGFNCAPGWDPVTGLGTPNFAVLSTLV